MELLSMDNLREGHKKLVMQHLGEFNNIGKANELIKFFSRHDLPKYWYEWIEGGYMTELNSILNS